MHRLHTVAILLVLCLLMLGRGRVYAQNAALGWDAIFQETANGVDIYTHAIALVVGLADASYTLYMYEQSPTGGFDTTGRPCAYTWLLTEGGTIASTQSAFLLFQGQGTIQVVANCNHAQDYTQAAADAFAWTLSATDANLSQLLFDHGQAYDFQGQRWVPLNDPRFIRFTAKRFQ